MISPAIIGASRRSVVCTVTEKVLGGRWVIQPADATVIVPYYYSFSNASTFRKTNDIKPQDIRSK